MTRSSLLHAAAASLLVAVAVLATNPHHVLPADLSGDGDVTANGLLVRDAADLALGYGPYSRLGFHHPGPVTFYAVAALAPAVPGVPSPLGRERTAMLVLNTLTLAVGLLLAVRLGGRLLDAWLAAACLCVTVLPIATTVHHPLLDYWGPLAVILPAFVFVAAAGLLWRGVPGPWPVFCAAGVVMVHNHIANAALVGPVGLVLPAVWAWRRRAGGPPAGRRARLWLGLGLAIVAVTSLPVAVEELAHADGNLTRTLRWIGEQPHQARSLADVLRAVGWSAGVAVTLGVPGLDRVIGLVPVWLVVLLGAGAAGIVHRARRRAGPELAAAAATAAAAYLLLLLFAWRMPENPVDVPYVFHETAAFAALLGWVAVRGPLLRLADRGRRRRVAAGLGAALVCVAWSVRFPVAPFPERCVPEAVWAALPPPASGPLNAYLEFGHEDHELWPHLAAFVLGAEQRGYRVRVPDAWPIMYGRRRTGPALPGAPLVLISGRDLDACLGPPLGPGDLRLFRVLEGEWSFDRLPRVLRSCGTPGLAAGPWYGAGDGAWGWFMWHGQEADGAGAFRWSQGPRSSLDFAAAAPLAALPGPVLELRLGALGVQEVTVALNGRLLGQVVVDGFAPRDVRLAVPAGVLEEGPGNELVLTVPGARRPGPDDPRVLGVRLLALRFLAPGDGRAGGP